MSGPIGPYVPFIIIAMVTWKVANSPSTSASTTTSSTSHTSSSSHRKPHQNPWESSISERLSARNIRHSRTASSPRSLASSVNGGHARRGSRPIPPGPGGGGGVRMGPAAGSRISYGAREGGRR
ncbi:hypothetical protein L873DRAFT_1800879 [Choiromyces venosus 120613-1]|uniref:Uncharacterized protein n=1 Tax=Choiromyces venosus 120613-1 TaxID=1336337 RepID=A0A3N4JYB4_9PEZI|nr:hypothetical protein L873DRAFT_1800879 [Choiromyces venosus 120613-1]